MYLGVDIGATKTLLALAKTPLDLIEQRKFSTPTDPDEFINTLRVSAKELIGTNNINAVGVAVPGQMRGTELVQAGRLPWFNMEFKDMFSWLPATVKAENDASIGGLAEARHGAGQDARQLLYVTVSTGIGSGIIVDKSIPDFIRGSDSGHAIIDYKNSVSFEDLASGNAFRERYGRLGKDVNDPKIWQEYGRLLGTGLYNMMTLTEPDVIIIGGSMGTFFKHYQKALEEQIATLNKFSIPNAPVRAAKFPVTAVIRGCISYAMEKNHA